MRTASHERVVDKAPHVAPGELPFAERLSAFVCDRVVPAGGGGRRPLRPAVEEAPRGPRPQKPIDRALLEDQCPSAFRPPSFCGFITPPLPRPPRQRGPGHQRREAR